MRYRIENLTRIFLPVFALLVTTTSFAAAPTSEPVRTVRVAAVGGINDLDFWQTVADRFEKTTGMKVQTVVTGNKDSVVDLFKKGGIDFITTESTGPILDLMNDGDVRQTEVWAKYDMLLAGPANDPAGVKGDADITDALKKISSPGNAFFLIHGSLGADQLIRDITNQGHISFDADHLTVLLDDHQKQVFQAAVNHNAYTLIARVPFLSGKIPNGGFISMVSGDPRLQRPIIGAIANPAKLKDVHLGEAQTLASFLRSAQTQQWISEFGKGKLDDRSLFLPAEPPAAASPTTAPSSAMLSVTGDVTHPLFLDREEFEKLPRHQIHTKNRDGTQTTYDGVLVSDVLKLAGLPLGDHKMNRANLHLFVRVQAADGYKVIFSTPELDPDFSDNSVLLADHHDGQPLKDNEGPLHLIVPQDTIAARSVRQVRTITVIDGQ